MENKGKRYLEVKRFRILGVRFSIYFFNMCLCVMYVNIMCFYVYLFVIRIIERYMLLVLILIVIIEELILREILGVFFGLALYKKYKLWCFMNCLFLLFRFFWRGNNF